MSMNTFQQIYFLVLSILDVSVGNIYPILSKLNKSVEETKMLLELIHILGLLSFIRLGQCNSPTRMKPNSSLNSMFPQCREQMFNPLSSTNSHYCANLFSSMASLTGLDVTVAKPEIESMRHMEVFIDYCNKLYIKHKYRVLMMGWHSPGQSKYSQEAQEGIPRPANNPLPPMAINPNESMMLLKCHDLQSKIEAMRIFVEGPKEETDENSADVYAKQVDKCQGLFFTLKAGQYGELIASFEKNNRSKEALGMAIVKCHSLIAILNGGSPELLLESEPICEHCKRCREILDLLGDGKLQEVEDEYRTNLKLDSNAIGQALAQCHKMGIKAMIQSLKGLPHGPHKMRSPPLVQYDSPMPILNDMTGGPAAIVNMPDEQCVNPSQLLNFFQPVIQLIQMQPVRVYNDMPLLKAKAEQILNNRIATAKEKIPKETQHICELFLAMQSAIPELSDKCCGVHAVCEEYLGFVAQQKIEDELVSSQTKSDEDIDVEYEDEEQPPPLPNRKE